MTARAKVIELHSYKEQQAAERGFRSWNSLFGTAFDNKTRLSDLPDKVLAFLVRTGPETQGLMYDLIMGAMALGPGAKFFYLEGPQKIKVLDVSLFLLDQVRFECMRRLGWISGFAGEHHTIIELVMRYEDLRYDSMNQVPVVLETNPEYKAYQEVFHTEREMFIRKQIPAAITAFLKTLMPEGSPPPEKE